MNRRSISGIMFYYQFEQDEKKKPTAFEDLPEDKQDEILNTLKPEAIKGLSKQLATTLRELGDQLDLSRQSK